ncbi:DsbA family protein [Nitrosophilus alvini]|uniref:DsbA family protein n=1 Tax=Nitrosophilus alvini TaxID=2714855 RepID=UPI00190D8423|nr:thioredoxin domain-containing protein [Nitrosophilus alvini]
MSSMLKLLSVSIIAATALFGATDAQIIKFVKKGLGKNPSIEVKKVEIVEKQPVEKPAGWDAYIIRFDLVLKRGKEKREIAGGDVIFVKGDMVSPDFIDLKTNRSLKKSISPTLKQEFYDNKRLLYGKKDAEHKIVVFSDPLCPFCKDIVPVIIEDVKKYPDKFALYYYHLPLAQLHPAAPTIAKAMIIFQKEGRKDLIKKIYETDFDPTLTDEKDILQELNKKLGTKLSVNDINQKWVLEHLKHDMESAQKLMVKGTPTIFLDGKKDISLDKDEYKKYIK